MPKTPNIDPASSPEGTAMHRGAADSQASLLDVLGDDPQQILRGRRMENGDPVGIGRQPLQHATRAGNRPMTPLSEIPPRPMPAHGSDDTAELDFRDHDFPTNTTAATQQTQRLRPQPQPQPHVETPLHHVHMPDPGPFAIRPALAQQDLLHSPGLGISWQHLVNSQLAGTGASGSSSNRFEHSGDYVSPASIHTTLPQATGFDFAVPWLDSGTGAVNNPAAASHAPPSDGLFNGGNLWLVQSEDGVEQEEMSPGARDTELEGSPPSDAIRQSKRQKGKNATGAQAGARPRRKSKDSLTTSPTGYPQDRRISFDSNFSTLASSTASGKGSAQSSNRPSKLRSASRSSKNTHHKPAETPEERRSRASHNLVEKQYRNRLNAQFESLLNALPEKVRGGGGGGGGGDCDESDPAPDYTDKRVSKAEVLDMARRHIRTLERERDTLEVERDELRSSLDMLRERYGRIALQPDEDGAEGATGGFAGLSDEDLIK